MHVVTENNKSIGQVVSELKNDARDFVSTRLQILTQEMNDKLKVWKAAIPILVVGALLGGMALIVLTQTGIAPTRTLRVLKQDQIWIQNEARSQV